MNAWRALYWIAILPFTACLWLSAEAFSAAQQHQTIYRYIADALTPSSEYYARVSWTTPETPLNRSFNEADEVLIGKALGEAWQTLVVGQSTGNDAILADRWTGPALERAIASVADAVRFEGRMAVVDQQARPIFFHKDGSLFQAEVKMIVSRFISGGDEPQGFSLMTETGIATLLNESNGWRVFSYERKTAIPLESRPVPWSGTANGVNYYPSATPWHDFWPAFDPDIVSADFSRIRALGGNSVRVFLPSAPFLTASSSDTTLDNLQALLDLAAAQDLQIIPTLFDLRAGYRASDWASDSTYLKRVLPVLAASEAVSFIDLKNEPDLDFDTHGRAQVLAWLQTMLGIVRRDAPELSVTVGWSAPDHAALLSENLDVITYHDYGPVSGSADRFNGVEKIADGKPVVVTEIGASTFEVALGFPGNEAGQGQALAERFDALEGTDGVLVWTLYDFPHVDPSVVGKSPWVRRLQSSFGLFRPDGTEKPSAKVVQQLFRSSEH